MSAHTRRIFLKTTAALGAAVAFPGILPSRAVGAEPSGPPADPRFEKIEAVPLFDGKSFDGWDGPQNSFRIEDGAIVGGTLKERIPRNEFMSTKKVYADFELRLMVKLVGKDANGGIQIRSKRIPDGNEMIGYQADLGQNYWGCLYDESRRRKVLVQPDAAELNKVLKREDWNPYVIRCVGKRIQLWLAGYQTVDYTEPDEKIEQTGVIGVQIHSGPPTETWYKDLMIKELPAAEK
jgi:hypothetical protein